MSSEAEKKAFKAKLKTINFGSVPGGARTGKNNFDRQALESQIGNLDANADYSRRATEGYGPLRWDKGEAYYQDRSTRDYSKLSASDLEKVMYGSKRREETKRSFSVGSRGKASSGG